MSTIIESTRQFREAVSMLQNVLSRITGVVLITTHQQADPDAIGAMVGMARLVSCLKKDARITLVLDDVSVISQHIISDLGVPVLSMNAAKILDISLIILVDSNNLEICPVAAQALEKNEDVNLVVIDHHEFSPKMATMADVYLVSQEAGSTSEIVSMLLNQTQVPIDENTALALTCGILYDSGFLARANARVFRILSWLCDVVPQAYSKARRLLSVSMVNSEKIARIKAAQRMRRKMVDDLVVIFTHVSSHEASAARGILSLGADLVVVVAPRTEETRISMRASSYFFEKTKVNLAQDLLPWLLQHFNGSGGGHSRAAGLNLVAGITLEQIMEKVLEYLNQHVSIEGDGGGNGDD